MGSSLSWDPFLGVPSIVRHPCKKEPNMDPDLENYPYFGWKLTNHTTAVSGLLQA